MAFFAEKWPTTYYRKVLRVGLRITWESVQPPRMDFGEYIPVTQAEESAVRKEQEELIAKMAVEEASEPYCVLPLFCIRKKDSKAMRPILNMKVLSPYIFSPRFKMEGLKAAKDLLRKDDWAVRIDLRDAYLHVKLHRLDRKFVQYRVDGRLYQWRTLPFGHRDAPRFFQKLIITAVARLREQGLRIVVYLDDMLVLGNSIESTIYWRDRVLSRMVQLGFTVNLEKSELEPSKEITFLGIVLRTADLTLSLPQQKLQAFRKVVHRTIRRAQNDREISAWQLQSLLGTLQATSECILQHRLHMNSIFECLNRAMRSPRVSVKLTEAAVQDLIWWRDNLHRWNGKAIVPPEVDREIEVDASNLGIAAVHHGERGDITAHQFVSELLHINYKELMAAEYGLRTFASREDWRNCTIRIKTDNLVAFAYINRMGGRIPRLCRLTERLHEFALERGIRVIAEWLPGKENVAADRLSRIRRDYSDKKLNPSLFGLIQQRFGKLDIDLFASKTNAQLSKYVSLRAEEEAWYTDAFSRPLPKGLAIYANPPFAVLGRFLAKVKREKAEAVVVAPVWTSQPWWPVLTEMMVGRPLQLMRKENMYILPNQYPPESMPAPKWETIVCKISGQDS